VRPSDIPESRILSWKIVFWFEDAFAHELMKSRFAELPPPVAMKLKAPVTVKVPVSTLNSIRCLLSLFFKDSSAFH
jgi:hypothetical protein